MPGEVRQAGTLMDNRDPGTGNELIPWANLILERLGWVDKSFWGEKAVWAVLVLLTCRLEGARAGRLLHGWR